MVENSVDLISVSENTIQSNNLIRVDPHPFQHQGIAKKASLVNLPT